MVFESRDELVERIGVGDAVDFDVGWEGGFGGGAGEDFDVAGEAGIGVKSGEDGGTEVAGDLHGCQRLSTRDEVPLFTPITMMFLRIDAIAGAWSDWPRRM